MKTHNLKFTALLLIMVLSITGNSFGLEQFNNIDEKKVVKVNKKSPIIKYITSALEISPEDMTLIKEQFNEVNFILTSNNISDNIELVNSGDTESLFLIGYHNESPAIEEWMVEDNYLYTEAKPVIEDWMLEESYTSAESEPKIEEWMYEEDFLNTESKPNIEEWMTDDNFFYGEAAPQVESWMTDEGFYSSTECCPEIEDWMMSDNYFNTEKQPEIENWMLDAIYSE